jgi:hypothetical protein
MAVFVVLTSACARYEAGGSVCGIGRVEVWDFGLGGISSQVRKGQVNTPCTPEGSGSAGGSSFAPGPVSSNRILYGEGRVWVYVKKTV